MEHLERYCALVDDPDAFLAAAQRPLPRVVWANPLRQDPEITGETVRRLCPDAAPLGWFPNAWRLPGDVKPGSWTEYMLGLVHGQEEAALWAAPLLGASPGERVLDLCAAPGNKAAQIAVAMHDRGTLVANERQFGRLAPLRRTLERLGVTCAVVTQEDGGSFPGEPGTYDRVLADVPCSCEGTSRKSDGRRWAQPERHRASIVQVQKAILRRALKLVRPGGTVVYATCTYAPEENEAVLDAIWTDYAVIEPVTPPPGLETRPGIAAWEGRTFRPDVVNAVRLWPHHNDTGGFFVARLRRL